jgi:hypothetical protein
MRILLRLWVKIDAAPTLAPALILVKPKFSRSPKFYKRGEMVFFLLFFMIEIFLLEIQYENKKFETNVLVPFLTF